MDENQRWEYLCRLDEGLLLGGAILSEWCIFITREADTAFAKGLHLATILLAVSAIETHLRAEDPEGGSARLVDLINTSGLPVDLKSELHALRKYRNRWVHIGESWDDQELLANPEQAEEDLEQLATSAVRVLRRTLYANPFV